MSNSNTNSGQVNKKILMVSNTNSESNTITLIVSSQQRNPFNLDNIINHCRTLQIYAVRGGNNERGSSNRRA